MGGFTFHKNSAFEWAGVQYRIERVQPDSSLLIENVASGQMMCTELLTLTDAYLAGEIRAVPKNAYLDTSFAYGRPLSDLSATEQSVWKRRAKYIEGILEEGQPIFTAAYLTPLLARIAQRLSDATPPSSTTFWRWYRDYMRHDSLRAVVPRTRYRGPRKLKQSNRVMELAEEAIQEAFKASPRATGQSVLTSLRSRIEHENQFLCAENHLKVPALRTIYRMLRCIEAYDMTVLREGKAVADRRFQIMTGTVTTENILERVEVDHTPLDLFLIDENTWLPLGRPYLTMCIDHFSRMPLGYYLTYEPPSIGSVVGALRHAILPKKPCHVAIPGLQIEHEWIAYGRPDLLVVDNGLEFYSDSLDGIALDLMMKLCFCPKRQPRFKGTIERYLKTINYFFAHQLPGTSLDRWHKRGDYDPEKQAVLTLSEFNQIFQKWLLDIYAQTPHRRTGETPYSRWDQASKRRTPELPESLQALQRCIGQVAQRSLRHDGIQLNGLQYSHETLAPILRAYGIGVKVRIVYDPDDLGIIYVWGPDAVDPVAVPALNQSYAAGLTLLQHRLIRESVAEKGASQTDIIALHRSRECLAQSVRDLMASRKQRSRRRAAAIRGLNSSRQTENGAIEDQLSLKVVRPVAPPTETTHLTKSSQPGPREQAPSAGYARFTLPATPSDH